jgi:hypothetical protein
MSVYNLLLIGTKNWESAYRVIGGKSKETGMENIPFISEFLQSISHAMPLVILEMHFSRLLLNMRQPITVIVHLHFLQLVISSFVVLCRLRG